MTGPQGLATRDQSCLASGSENRWLKKFQLDAMDAKLVSSQMEKQIRNRRTLFGRQKNGSGNATNMEHFKMRVSLLSTLMA